LKRYSSGLSYQEVKDLEIIKTHMTELFIDHVLILVKHIFVLIGVHTMSSLITRWIVGIVFYNPPHGNMEL
jgi:hypothetical protein